MRWIVLIMIMFMGCSSTKQVADSGAKSMAVTPAPVANSSLTSCFSYNRDSITCRTKRVQAVLGELETQLYARVEP